MSVPRVLATEAALALIATLRQKYGDNLLFYQAGGCCEGSAPLCCYTHEIMIGVPDLLLGELGGIPFYINRSVYEYWKHTQLIIDALPGNGSSFSLESTENMAFHLNSRLFSDTEWAELQAGGLV